VLAGALGKKDAAVDGLLDELEETADESAKEALVKEPEGANMAWHMSSDVRTSAVVLETLVALRPSSKRIRPLVRGLLRARKRGTWSTTQETIYSLIALSRYAKSRAVKPVIARISGGSGEKIVDQRLDRRHRIRRISVPLKRLMDGGKIRLKIAPRGGRLHYAVRLRYRRELKYQRGRASGMSMWHAYLDSETKRRVKKITEGDVIRVRVAMRTDTERVHVILSERLPAAFEPINLRLATSGKSRRTEVDDEDEYEREWLGYRHVELRDDRVDLAAELLPEGGEVREFLVRATTPGKFVVPSATVEEMYQPEHNARTGLKQIEVLPR
jgi:uncharacterized protein YfaS (alpha-2-macroglobulin family)